MARVGSWTAGARRTARRLQSRTRLRAPRLSVLVVAGSADARELDISAHAARALPGADLELILVAPENSAAAEVAQRHAAEDWRVTACSTEAEEAIPDSVRGRYVITLSAGAVPQRAAIDDAIDQLGASGAQLGLGTGPDAAVLSHTVLARDLWKRVDRREGAAVFLVRAIELAQGRVSLTRPIVRIQELPAAQGMVDTRPRLDGWLADQTAAWKLIGSGPVAPVWAASVLAGPISAFVTDVERFEPGQRAALRRLVNALDQALTPEDWAEVPVLARVQAWLLARGRHQDLIDLVAAQRFENGQFATTVAHGSVSAVLPVPDDVPAELLLLSAEETPLRARLQRLRWDTSEIEATLFAYVAGVDLLDHQPEVTVALVGSEGERLPIPCELSADRDVTRWAANRYQNHDRGLVTARIPAAALTLDRWRFEVTISVAGLERSGTVEAVEPGGSVAVFGGRAIEDQYVSLEPGPTLVVRAGGLPEGAAEPDQVSSLALDAEALVLTCADPAGVEVVGPSGVLPSGGAGRWLLQHDPWGLGTAPLPSGRYVVRAVGGAGLRWSEAVTDQLPLTVLTENHRVVLRLEAASGGHRLVCQIGAPLTDDEVGPWCQRRLQTAYRAEDRPLLHDAVYFQSYTGQSATDSPRAISDELARTGAELTRYWAVADRSTLVPPGTIPVLWGSRDWYDALARSRSVVTNIELERWFSRKPGQQVLQTFHGYPSKAMGLGLWRSKNFTESRIEQQLDRTSRAWTLLLTPAPEMDVHYRDNYLYRGPILAAGYPRDDALRSPQAGALRDAARARLGLGPGVTAVLYAPTWRDDEAANFRSAKMVDHLDVEAAAEALGPGFVLLLRGHRFMARNSGGSSARVLDVSSYPEINDLILAADVAVLDYSSLRFDFALTGKPMVFLVPDLESYATLKRGFLYDFEPTAPGPLLRTSDQVIAALKDLGAVAAGHAEDYARFNASYNRYQDGKAAERTIAAFLG